MKTKMIESKYGNLEVPDDKIYSNMVRYGGLQTPKQKIMLDQKVIHSTDIVLDIGAHVGTFSIPFALQCKPPKIYAVEATNESYEVLLRNIKHNRLENVIAPIHAIVSDSNQTMAVKDPSRVKANESWIKQYHPSKTGVKGFTLDEMFKDLDSIDFVKMDIEGSEIRALKGFRELLKKHSPVLYIECSDLALKEQNYTMQDMEDEVRSHGYNIFVENHEKYGYREIKTLNDSLTKTGHHGSHYDCFMFKDRDHARGRRF
jgi:FkbM family methyltransferase